MDTPATPAASEARIGMLDTARGIAVLGILVMNIAGFGLPRSYDDPTRWGGAEGMNLTVWRIAELFFEGTMRGIFTLLFGAGALLFVARHSARNPGLLPADLYLRRTLWLTLFGLINAYLLVWPGDILFYYGIVGFPLFVFRNVSPRNLVVTAAVLMVLQTGVSFAEWHRYHEVSTAAVAAQEARNAGKVLTQAQAQAIDQRARMDANPNGSREMLEQLVSRMRASYVSAFRAAARETWHNETIFFLQHGLLESLGMMLLGMALLKYGVLTGAVSPRVYVTMLLAGYAIGLSVNLYETNSLIRSGFSNDAKLAALLTYDLGRIPMTLGHVGLIGLLCRSWGSSAVPRTLAAVGRMALTNYLAQSVICLFVFTGAGLALYGQLERCQLYYVVAALWILQLIWSPLWLRSFRFGPAEWLWRSLTHWRKQPMRREADLRTG